MEELKLRFNDVYIDTFIHNGQTKHKVVLKNAIAFDEGLLEECRNQKVFEKPLEANGDVEVEGLLEKDE